MTTIAVGMAASMGTILLTGGTAGRRYALPNATIHLHQPLGGVQGQASDIEIEAKEILRLRDLLNGILQKHTGLSDEQIDRYTDRNFYMTAEMAKELGIIDQVLSGPERGQARAEEEQEQVDDHGETPRCSFCMRSSDEVKRLIAGPTGRVHLQRMRRPVHRDPGRRSGTQKGEDEPFVLEHLPTPQEIAALPGPVRDRAAAGQACPVGGGL